MSKQPYSLVVIVATFTIFLAACSASGGTATSNAAVMPASVQQATDMHDASPTGAMHSGNADDHMDDTQAGDHMGDAQAGDHMDNMPAGDHMDNMQAGDHMDDGEMMAAHAVPADAAAVENPLPATEAVQLAGEATFQQTCAACHGPTGRGDGPAAAALEFKPADLRADHVQGLSDGGLYYIVTHGRIERGMPAWEDALSEQTRWEIVRYLRTLVQ